MTGHDAGVTASRRSWPLRSLAVVLAVAVLPAVLAAPARADVGRFDDRVHDTDAPADITRVIVNVDTVVTVRVRHRNLGFGPRAPMTLRLDIDTGPRFDGPEFFVRLVYQSDAPVDVHTARGWARVAGPATGCTGERSMVSAARDVTRLRVPARCLGSPARLRVHVRLTSRAGAAVDVAPRARTMGPWVHR